MVSLAKSVGGIHGEGKGVKVLLKSHESKIRTRVLSCQLASQACILQGVAEYSLGSANQNCSYRSCIEHIVTSKLKSIG